MSITPAVMVARLIMRHISWQTLPIILSLVRAMRATISNTLTLLLLLSSILTWLKPTSPVANTQHTSLRFWTVQFLPKTIRPISISACPR